MEKIKTGITTLDNQIGGLAIGAVTVIYGTREACQRMWAAISASNTQAVEEGTIVCMTFSEDVERDTLHDIYVMATRYRKCVVALLTMPHDTPTIIADMAETVIYAEMWRGKDVWAMVRKNRSKGIHETWHYVPCACENFDNTHCASE